MLSLRPALVAAFVVWNGYFVAAVIYGSMKSYTDEGFVIRIVVTIWVWGDAAILLAAIAVWALVRSRKRVA